MYAIKEFSNFIDNIDGEVSLGIAVLFVFLWFGFCIVHGYYSNK
jgi:hypothetical protein